jgi:hypothetical protein
MGKRPVLLIGSVALPTATDVFKEVSEHLGTLAPSVPDGETGDRNIYVGWQSQRWSKLDGLRVVRELEIEGHISATLRWYEPQDGFDLRQIDFRPLGYAAAAINSYAEFKRLKDAGGFAPNTRFQVSLPTAIEVAIFFPKHMNEVLPGLEAAYGDELSKMLAVIPADQLAIQWDLASQTQIEEIRRYPGKDRWKREGMVWPMEWANDSLARLASKVPPEVKMGLHLCYGNPDDEPLIAPVDTSTLVDISRDLLSRIKRRIDWIHMPVPKNRDDAAYFAPLNDLKLPDGTQLYLGLVHLADGVEGATRRMRAADKYVHGYGVASECGLGRKHPTAIIPILDLHRQVATL